LYPEEGGSKFLQDAGDHTRLQGVVTYKPKIFIFTAVKNKNIVQEAIQDSPIPSELTLVHK
jgi:hypothetical protein